MNVGLQQGHYRSFHPIGLLLISRESRKLQGWERRISVHWKRYVYLYESLIVPELDYFFQTISDSVNDLLRLEEEWKKNGHSVIGVPPFA